MNVLGSIITKFGQKLIFMVLVLVITGCTRSYPYKNVPLLSDKDVANTTKGVVVARVIAASAQPNSFPAIDLVPKNFNVSNRNKIQMVRAIPAKSNHSAIFAGALKPGSYSLGSVNRSNSFNGIYYTDRVKSGFKFGTFTVEANKITDLGTLIYYPKSDDDGYIETLIRLPAQEPGKLVNQFFSFYPYEPSQVLSWDEDGFADERESTYLSAVQNPVAFNHEYLADDGYLYFLAPLGMIVIRTPEGEWLTDAIDTNLAMRAIAKNAAGDLIVGGDEGKVFVKRSGGGLWEDISINHDFDVHQVAFDDANTMLVFASKETNMGLFKSQESIAGMAPNWQIPLRFNIHSGWFKNDGNRTDWQRAKGLNRIMNAKLDDFGDGMILSVDYQEPSLIPHKGVDITNHYTADLNDLSFERTMQQSDVDFVIDAGAREIGVERANSYSSTGNPTFHIKNEQTGQWDTITTRIKREGSKIGTMLFFKILSAPWFSSAQNGVAIAIIKKDKKPKIMQTIDGGKTWTKTDYKLPKDYCVNIVSMITDRLLLSCSGVSSDFYESTDSGKTWQQVREHEQF